MILLFANQENKELSLIGRSMFPMDYLRSKLSHTFIDRVPNGTLDEVA